MSDSRNSTALVIIGAVLVLTFVVGMWFFSNSKPQPNTNININKPSPSAVPAKTPNTIQPDAPKGAEPPNQAGSPTATVTLEEFADYQCPACAVKNPVIDEIKTTYGTRIHLIYRNNPLPIHDKSYDAAVAAEAAGLQGKFWEMHDILYAKQGDWTASTTYKDVWKGYAKQIGLNVEKWENDMAGIAAKGRVDADLERAKSANIRSTPTLFFNGKEMDFAEISVPTLRERIDAELQKAAPQAPAAGANTGNSNQ